MDKFFQYLYYTVLTLFLCSVIYLTTVLFLAPRQDVYDRGFIACTRKLVYDLSGCEQGKIGCPLKYLWRDMKCNVGIIYDGAAAWVKGEQPTPWANYLFEPQLLTEEEQDIYPSDAAGDMSDIERQNQLILLQQQEFEAAKNRMLNMDNDVVIFNPEEQLPTNLPTAETPADTEVSEQGDITDEADIAITAPENPETSNSVAPQSEDILKNIKQKTVETLQKGNSENEK